MKELLLMEHELLQRTHKVPRLKIVFGTDACNQLRDFPAAASRPD